MWFEELTGFNETSPQQVRNNLTVVVWVNAGTQSASNKQIRISFSVTQINDGLATATGSGSGQPNKHKWS